MIEQRSHAKARRSDFRSRIGCHDGVCKIAGDPHARRTRSQSGSAISRQFCGREIALPIMPVEDGNTSAAGTPRIFATSRQTRSQAKMPARPVAQFALPEFTITARRRPPVAASAARPTSTGAATTRLLVKSAAAATRRISTSARSGRPLSFIPVASAEKEKPRGQQNCLGRATQFRRGHAAESYKPSSRVEAESQTPAVLREPSPLRRS